MEIWLAWNRIRSFSIDTDQAPEIVENFRHFVNLMTCIRSYQQIIILAKYFLHENMNNISASKFVNQLKKLCLQHYIFYFNTNPINVCVINSKVHRQPQILKEIYFDTQGVCVNPTTVIINVHIVNKKVPFYVEINMRHRN